MARSWFGGTSNDFVFRTFNFAGQQLLNLSPATLTFWDSAAAGTQYTDLLLDGVVAVSSVDVGATGQVPRLQGPDGVTTMWADTGAATRTLMITTDATAIHADRVAAEAAAAAAAAVGSTNDTIIAGRVNAAGSATRVALDALYAGGGIDSASQAELDALSAQQALLMASAATIEEVQGGAYINGRWSSGTLVQTLAAAAGQHIVTAWIAPWACTILSLDVVVETNSITADDTNFLTLDFRRLRAGTTSVIATKTTKVTGGEAITNRVPWSFDGASWDPTAKVFAKGDMLQLRWSATGTAVLTYPFGYTFRVAPS